MIRALQAIGLLMGTLLLAACATPKGLAPTYALVDADTLEIRRSLDSEGADEFPPSNWWRDFGDQQLDALLDEALSDSPSMAKAHARLLAARAQAGLADAERTPVMGSTLRYSGLQLPQSMLGEAGGTLRGSGVVTFDFAWSPDLWGAQRPLLELEHHLVSLRARRLTAAVDLGLALGGGLPRLPDAFPDHAP